jgi:hypothetical protein
MRTSRPTRTIGLAAVSLFALAACTVPGSGDGGAGGDGTGSDGSSGGSGSLAGCLEGSWAADLDDLAAQLQAFFVENGTPVVSTEAAGTSSLDVEGATMTYDSQATFTMVADSNGLVMIITQDQIGVSTGDWAVDGDSVVYSGWETGIEITTTITIGGTSAGSPTIVPGDGGDGLHVATTCDGDTLTTTPDGSPFTTTWARVG